MSRLIEDAPYRVRNYLADNAEGHPPLQAVYDDEYEWVEDVCWSLSAMGAVFLGINIATKTSTYGRIV